jgi:N-acetylglucosamine repressor
VGNRQVWILTGRQKCGILCFVSKVNFQSATFFLALDHEMKRLTEKTGPERARTHNAQLVLKTIYESGQISRADVARATGLTRPTISDMVAELMERGLIEEVGYAPSTGGKRPLLMSIADDSRHLIGINLAREDFSGAVINLRGQIRHRVDLALGGRNGNVALTLVYEVVDALIKATGTPLLGIGIGAPGLVDATDGVMRQAVNLNWRDIPLRHLLQERYHLPVYVANDCQVAALAEYTFGSNGDSTKDLVVINVGWGVGAGIVLDGHLLYGNPFGAGEIGHVTVAEDGERCQCGNRGCLETVVSTRALVRRAQAIARNNPDSLLHRFAANPEAIGLDTVYRLFIEGDRATLQAVRDIGRNLGIAAANLVGVLGACRILIAGRVACFGQFLLDAIREEMTRRCFPSLARDTEVGFVSLGPDIVLLGASALLLRNELGLFVTA